MKNMFGGVLIYCLAHFLFSADNVLAFSDASDVLNSYDRATVMYIRGVMPDAGPSAQLYNGQARKLAATIDTQKIGESALTDFLPDYVICFYADKQLVQTTCVSFRKGFIGTQIVHDTDSLTSNLHFTAKGLKFQTETAEAQKLKGYLEKLFTTRK
jgi:hypothetical protein